MKLIDMVVLGALGLNACGPTGAEWAEEVTKARVTVTATDAASTPATSQEVEEVRDRNTPEGSQLGAAVQMYNAADKGTSVSASGPHIDIQLVDDAKNPAKVDIKATHRDGGFVDAPTKRVFSGLEGIDALYISCGDAFTLGGALKSVEGRNPVIVDHHLNNRELPRLAPGAYTCEAQAVAPGEVWGPKTTLNLRAFNNRVLPLETVTQDRENPGISLDVSDSGIEAKALDEEAGIASFRLYVETPEGPLELVDQAFPNVYKKEAAAQANINRLDPGRVYTAVLEAMDNNGNKASEERSIRVLMDADTGLKKAVSEEAFTVDNERPQIGIYGASAKVRDNVALSAYKVEVVTLDRRGHELSRSVVKEEELDPQIHTTERTVSVPVPEKGPYRIEVRACDNPGTLDTSRTHIMKGVNGSILMHREDCTTSSETYGLSKRRR